MHGMRMASVTGLDADGMQKVKDKEVVVYNVKVFRMRRTIFITAQAKYKRIRFLFAG
jgi:hypothetical protein